VKKIMKLLAHLGDYQLFSEYSVPQVRKDKVVPVLKSLSTVPLRYMRDWRYSSNIVDLGTIQRSVVRFTPRSIYPRGKDSSTDWIGGQVGSRAGLDAMKNIKKNLPHSGIELRPFSS
jgi:hypothetical protein